MKILDLHLENFRQFFGKQTIEFARTPKKNITVIHGYNGAGKTALLNAFVWGMYGTTTPDFEEPDKLVNERAISETPPGQTVDVAVKLRFRARDKTYIVERRAVAERKNDGTFVQGKPELKLWEETSGGELERADTRTPQRVLNQLLPERLYPFFLFNGERVESLASRDAYENVEGGVKMLLDVEIYERSVRHLRDVVSAELSKELREYGTEEMQEAVDRETALRTQLADLRSELQQTEKNDAAIESEIEKLEQRQAGIREIEEQVRRRDEARRSLRSAEKSIRDERKDIATSLSRSGYLTFGERVFAKVSEFVQQARQRGELPAKIKPQFVTDLLEAGKCICGRPIDADSQEASTLMEWRSRTGLAALEDAISGTGALITTLADRRGTYIRELDTRQARLDTLYTERRGLREELDELEEEIGDRSQGEDALELQERLSQRRLEQVDVRAQKQNQQQKRDGLESDLAAVEKDIERQKSENEKATLIQRQKAAVQRIADVLDAIYTIQKHDVRKYLADKIGEIWEAAAVKDYRATVTDDFRLVLTKQVHGNEQPVHGASTGEKQILALSFVGALVRRAKLNEERAHQAGSDDYGTGGDYPLVMDSPFGSLEDDYRSAVAEWIPSLASQVVVMVSKTQWRHEVENRMRDRIGKEYILELHTSKENADARIEIDDEEHPYVVSTSDPCEQTTIQEVK